MLHSQRTSFCSSFTWQHSSVTAAYLLQKGIIVSPERHQACWTAWDPESYIYHQKIWLEASDTARAVDRRMNSSACQSQTWESIQEWDWWWKDLFVPLVTKFWVWLLPLLDAPRWWGTSPPCCTGVSKQLRHALFACSVHHIPGRLYSLWAPYDRVGVSETHFMK